ncbi:MAG: nucleotide-diphospho-sugar transferase [Olpidium bornovanus]|uniref:UDP-N-acetylglucosamine diphosphorylase n=1 Tax=Olpidium bornovanus TaxID=278681 RepID=A0A8H7ZUX0_9FUNG|nr:MAG: nucleotide-diphospho-sugar transferase [Olpidium bornovanus]
MAPSLEAVRAKLEKCGQGHLLAFYDKLADADRAALLGRLDSLDVERATRICRKSLRDLADLEAGTGSKNADLKPLPDSSFASLVAVAGEGRGAGAAAAEEWEAEGLRQIARGAVAVVVMAGGQGTRLGSTDPKGCYDIKLPSRKSLFQLQAERIARLQQLAARRLAQEASADRPVVIPWYVMTSGPTRGATEKFFRDHRFFGLDPENVVFFEQANSLTLVNFLFDAEFQISAAPDGNGGVYAALKTEKVLDDMDRRGIKYVHAYCVDNW